jgi:Tfp pilus assembly protein PilF
MSGQDYLLAGLEAFRAGDYTVAIHNLEQATFDDPDSFRAFTFLGAAYAEHGRYNASIGSFKKAAEIKPDVAKVHYNLGQAYEAAGVPTEAWFEYKKALEIDPFYQQAKAAIAELSSRLKLMREQRLELAA